MGGVWGFQERKMKRLEFLTNDLWLQVCGESKFGSRGRAGGYGSMRSASIWLGHRTVESGWSSRSLRSSRNPPLPEQADLAGSQRGPGSPGRGSSHVPCVLEAPSFPTCPGKSSSLLLRSKPQLSWRPCYPLPHSESRFRGSSCQGPGQVRAREWALANRQCRGGREIKAVLNPAVTISVFVDWMVNECGIPYSTENFLG